MSGPFKISMFLLGAVCLLVVAAQAQGQPKKQNRNNGGFRVEVGPNDQRRAHMGDWLRQNRGKSFDQQKKSLENDPEFKKLAPERQEQLRQRLQNFNNLSPEQQQRILQRIDKFEHMTPQQRAQARALWDRMRLFPEERRGLVRQQIHSLASMSPEQRQRTMNSDDFTNEFSADERDVIGRSLQLTDSGASASGAEENAPR
jgi:hypothetical protein